MRKNPIFKEERHNLICEMAEKTNSVNVNILANDFCVSVETIRRDLNFLEKKGILTRIHGGAISVLGQRKDNEKTLQVHSRSQINLEEKKKIAKYALNQVNSGDVIYLSPGSTVFCLAELLMDFTDLTILTNSILLANMFVKSSIANVIVIGGKLKKHELSLIDIFNEDFISSIHIDKGFIGCTGIHPIHGLSNNNKGEIATDIRMVTYCKNVYVLADSTKFGFVGNNLITSLENIDDIVTTERASKAILDKLIKKNIRVHIAK